MMEPLKTIIIDDEELARERMKRLLAGFSSDFTITGEASNGNEAELAIESLKPDIVFLDIQMPGKNVFEILSELNHKPFIVFCTAHDSYALKAFETHAIDYLIKPVDENRLKFTIEKIKKFVNSEPNYVSFQKILETFKTIENKQVPTSIHHKVGDRTILIKIEKVTYLEAEDKYVSFYTADSKKYMSDQSLKLLEEKLPENFVRISKSVIINKDYVIEMHRYFRGCVIFVLDDSKRTKIQSGRAFSEKIKNMF